MVYGAGHGVRMNVSSTAPYVMRPAVQ